MPKYKYKAKSADNKVLKGIFLAQDEEDLREILAGQNCYLIKCKKVEETASLFTFLEHIKPEDFALFCDQFSIMLSSGMEVLKVIEILKVNSKVKKLRDILEGVYVEVQQGKMLSEAFAKYPKTFPPFFQNMIVIGEKSGHLDTVFKSLSVYYTKESQTKKKVKSALAYPIFLISIAIGVLALLALYIIPMFKNVFEEMNADLPPISIAIISVSDFLKNNILFIVCGAVMIFLIFFILNRQKSYVKRKDRFKITHSITKGINLTQITTRLTRGLSLLLRSGIKITESMEIMSNLLGNLEIKDKLQVSVNELKRGKTIASSLATINTFPPMLIEMIDIGEKSGTLEDTLDKVTEYYEAQLDEEIKRLTSVLEPVLIMFVALIVVFVMLAVFLPILELQNSIANIGE